MATFISTDAIEEQWTGAGDLAVGTNYIAPAAAFKLVSVELHLSAAPTTGTQNFVVTKDDGTAAAYDMNLLTQDLVAGAITNLILLGDDNVFKSTDVITVAWTNTDVVTYGLTIKYRLV